MVESPGYMKENMWTFLMQNNNKKKHKLYNVSLCVCNVSLSVHTWEKDS